MEWAVLVSVPVAAAVLLGGGRWMMRAVGRQIVSDVGDALEPQVKATVHDEVEPIKRELTANSGSLRDVVFQTRDELDGHFERADQRWAAHMTEYHEGKDP